MEFSTRYIQDVLQLMDIQVDRQKNQISYEELLIGQNNQLKFYSIIDNRSFVERYKIIIALGRDMSRREGAKGEQQAIEHIKYMARAIYHDTSPNDLDQSTSKDFYRERYSRFIGGGQKPQKQSRSHSKGIQVNPQQLYSEQKQRLGRGGSSHIPRQKLGPYFKTSHQFQQLLGQREVKKQRPISDSINHNIYAKFKAENKAARNIVNNQRPNQEQVQLVWKNFLVRAQQFSKDNKNKKREANLINFLRPSTKKNKHRRKDTLNEGGSFNRKMTEIQNNLWQLKQKTQQVRLTIIKVAQQKEERPSKKLRRTFADEY